MKIEIGRRYIIEDDNPFESPIEVVVIDVRSDYVQYRRVQGSWNVGRPMSLRKSLFAACFKPLPAVQPTSAAPGRSWFARLLGLS